MSKMKYTENFRQVTNEVFDSFRSLNRRERVELIRRLEPLLKDSKEQYIRSMYKGDPISFRKNSGELVEGEFIKALRTRFRMKPKSGFGAYSVPFEMAIIPGDVG